MVELSWLSEGLGLMVVTVHVFIDIAEAKGQAVVALLPPRI